jgi:hypothetical protein
MNSISHYFFSLNSLQVFPNPTTKGKVVNLIVKRKGQYSIALMNNKSEALHTQQILVNNSNEINLFSIPANIEKGNYVIKGINMQNKKTFQCTIQVV